MALHRVRRRMPGRALSRVGGALGRLSRRAAVHIARRGYWPGTSAGLRYVTVQRMLAAARVARARCFKLSRAYGLLATQVPVRLSVQVGM